MVRTTANIMHCFENYINTTKAMYTQASKIYKYEQKKFLRKPSDDGQKNSSESERYLNFLTLCGTVYKP